MIKIDVLPQEQYNFLGKLHAAVPNYTWPYVELPGKIIAYSPWNYDTLAIMAQDREILPAGYYRLPARSASLRQTNLRFRLNHSSMWMYEYISKGYDLHMIRTVFKQNSHSLQYIKNVVYLKCTEDDLDKPRYGAVYNGYNSIVHVYDDFPMIICDKISS